MSNYWTAEAVANMNGWVRARFERMQRERVLVHENVDDEEFVHVYAWVEDDGDGTPMVNFMQGDDLIIIPYSDIGKFVDNCEKLYAS